jgi:AcrR family transcriptional regulator
MPETEQETERETTQEIELIGVNYQWRSRVAEVLRDSRTDKQIAILIAAIELFSEKGFAAATTREIARLAGVAEGSVFKQYASKEELFAVIVDLISAEIFFPLLSHGLAELLAREFTSLEGLFQALLQNRAEVFQENLVPIRLLLQEMPHRPEMRAAFLSGLQQMPLLETLASRQVREFLPDLSPRESLHILMACLSGFFLTRFIMFPEYFAAELDQDIARFIKFTVSGLKGCAEGGNPHEADDHDRSRTSAAATGRRFLRRLRAESRGSTGYRRSRRFFALRGNRR